MKGLRFRSSHFVVALAVAAASPGQDLATSLRDYLRQREFSEKDLRAVERGQAVVKLLDAEDDSETQLLGVVKIQGAPEEFLSRYRGIVSFEKGAGILQIGLLSDPPAVDDLAALTIDPVDVEDLKECRPGDCGIKLSAEAIQTFQRIDWEAEGAVSTAEALAREMLVDFLRAYQEGGNAALGTLHDKDEPLEVGQAFAAMIESPEFPAYFPDLYSYLNDYPAAKIPGAEELFYWSKVDFGLKPMIRLNHVVIYEPSGRPDVRYAVASKMLYSSHYFNTGVEMKFLTVTRESSNSYYLVANNQSRSDGFSGLTGFFAGRKIRGKARGALESYLASVKRNLERGPSPSRPTP
ncbi:MAG: hypothetical protein ACRD21_05500 [Vicinamibacteria bacterium]